ncbi:hypothetical protein DFH08DRAFT_955964 [Mycena albidolilacea]|uniref:F-box domain-containing protein n=1 Tax=Mycena albidolilacea TaxID=1033008 RepID=A0AAD7AD14_9AGAR|nr:hypothetical protein DFH08DRAFT_955964 [Mycena albidolilacea]
MSSPFALRLGTNYSAQDKEIDEIKALLVEPCRKLKRLDDEIDVMRKALDKLVKERDTLSACVEAHKALLSPFRRLPRDIIEAIFMACLPTHHNCVMSAQEAPVILGRICSSWRMISHSFPRLWSSLHIVEPVHHYNSSPGLHQAKVAQRLEVVDAWLRRSGMCPLSISLQSYLDHGIGMDPPFMESTPNTDSFLHILVPFASRWQNISLTISLSAVQALLRLTENEVPLLKSLTITECRENPYDSTTWTLPQACVLGAPGLARFSLSGRNVHSLDLPLCWSNLTALSLLGSGWSTGTITANPQTCQVVLDILSRCPELRTCTVMTFEPPDSGYLPDFVVECPFLHTFDLLCDSTPLHTAGRLLSRLSLPALQDFQLEGINFGGPDPENTFSANSLLSFFAASTRLESINIDGAMFSKAILIDIFRRLPLGVRHITIARHVWQPRLADTTLDDEVLEALTVSPGHSLCPALEEMVIHYCPKVSDEAILRFIMSRMPTLKFVDIKFDRERKVDILPTLQPFFEAGLKTSISYITFPSPSFSPWAGLPDPPTISPPFGFD